MADGSRAYNFLMGRDLATERCLPCERGTTPLQLEDALALLRETEGKWRLSDDHRALTRQITFKTFGRAMAFLNRLAEIAECEGHHPDFCLSRWNQVSLSLTTHAIGGLSRNDFVLAAKLQTIIRRPSET
jgi:4a-hydroxytetrahydrobiopterin dehydratase